MLTALQEYNTVGYKPIRCFPNSFKPLYSEMQSDEVNEEDAESWEDFNIAVTAYRDCSALVFDNFKDYQDYLDEHRTTPYITLLEDAPTVLMPNGQVALWFKNPQWVAQNYRSAHSTAKPQVVNMGLLPAPPSIVGGVECVFVGNVGRAAKLVSIPDIADYREIVPRKTYAYGENVIPLSGMLAFSYPAPQPHMDGGLLDRGSKIAIIGEPKIGKSRFILNLAMCLALKEPFLDIDIVRAARVLFVQFEVSEPRMHQRVVSVADSFNLSPTANVPLYFSTLPNLRLDTDEGAAVFERLVRACKPDVVFLDPLSKIHQREENSASDMQSELFDRLDNIILKHNVSLIIAHHVNKRSDVKGWARVRGSGALPAWVDGFIILDRPTRNADIEAVAVLRSGAGWSKTIRFRDDHRIESMGDQTPLETYCADAVIANPQLTRRQLAALVAREFTMSVPDVLAYFKSLEDKGITFPP
jgi:KaiC/GvpD/RAD55 family RecA-like ATPase